MRPGSTSKRSPPSRRWIPWCFATIPSVTPFIPTSTATSRTWSISRRLLPIGFRAIFEKRPQAVVHVFAERYITQAIHDDFYYEEEKP